MSIEATVFKGSASDGIVESKTTFEAPTGTKVLVRITHSGVCGTDEHYKHADMVLGHEGVGVVEKIGEGVTDFAVGDVVGWGAFHKTCGKCEQCLKGQDNYCRAPGLEMYGAANLHQGSFGTYAAWDEAFLFKVPAGIAPEHAAPMMCGGATVFEVIESYNIRPTARVGVIGLGGLGSMAVQILSASKVEVVVFSSTQAKKEEALAQGATEFVVADKDVQKFEGVKPLDHLIVTTNTLADWTPYLGILKPKSTIFPLTVAFSEFKVPAFPALFGGITIQNSFIGSRATVKRLLEFAARNEIKPIVEKFPMTKTGVEESMQKLRDGKVRYRAVLVV